MLGFLSFHEKTGKEELFRGRGKVECAQGRVTDGGGRDGCVGTTGLKP